MCNILYDSPQFSIFYSRCLYDTFLRRFTICQASRIHVSSDQLHSNSSHVDRILLRHVRVSD